MTAIPTTERLAQDLEEAGAPAEMIERARAGYYDDYKSDLAMPEVQLLQDARRAGLTSIAEGVLEGRWDATKEEADAWARSPDGQETFRELLAGKKPRK
jgi:hypothetical protein